MISKAQRKRLVEAEQPFLEAVTKNEKRVIFKPHSEKDKDGKQSFSMYWWSEGFHLGPSARSQVFYAELANHVAKWRGQGFSIRIDRQELS